MIKKLLCVNISSKDPKALAVFYRTIGAPVYVNNDCYGGWNLGNPQNAGSVCVMGRKQVGQSGCWLYHNGFYS